jgi:hypothetical protein
MHSALYTGRLSHHRRRPVRHAFDYGVCYAWLDLAELDVVFRGRWLWSTRRPALAWLRRADYLGDPAVPLDSAVRDRVEAETGRRPSGPVRLLTQLRTFGHCFNPVSFYYCYDADGRAIETVVAEITNTPWDERHAYVLPIANGKPQGTKIWRFGFEKAFHVSPFLPMDMHYDWRFREPGSELNIHMNSYHNEEKYFDATLTLTRREISSRSLNRMLIEYPFVTVKIITMIYWQALRLFAKHVPFYPHPPKQLGRDDS